MGVIEVEKFSFNLLSDYKGSISMHKTGVGQVFNRIFGRNETNVYNDTGRIIKAIVSSTVLDIVEEEVEVNTRNGVRRRRVVQPSTIVSWINIPYEESQRFDRGDNQADYLTIAKSYEYGWVVIIKNYKMAVNYSYIVERDGTLSKQKYGSSDLSERE